MSSDKSEWNGGLEVAMKGKKFLCVFLIILGGLAAYYIYEEELCRRMVPTGDLLFDAYAKEVAASQSWRLFRRGTDNPAALSSKAIDRLEAKFPDDLRIGELRFISILHTNQENWGGFFYPIVSQEEQAENLLDKQFELGKLSLPALMLLYDKCYNESYDYTFPDSGLKPEVEEKLGKILNVLVKDYGDFAWAHYKAGLHYMEREQFQKALSYFRQGNASPHFDIPRCFPVNVVLDQHSQGNYAGNATLSGAIIEMEWYSNPVSSYRYERYAAPNFVKWLAENGSQEDWQTVHKFACRVGSGKSAGFFELQFAQRLDRELLYSLLEHHPDNFSSSQRNVLLNLIDRHWRLTRNIKQYRGVIGNNLAFTESPNIVGTTAVYVYDAPGITDNYFLHWMYYLYYGSHPDGYRLQAQYSRKTYAHFRKNAGWVMAQIGDTSIIDCVLPDNWIDVGAQFYSSFPVMVENPTEDTGSTTELQN